MEHVTQEKLKEILFYDGSTGVFLWKEKQGNFLSYAVAGNITKQGRYAIKIDGKSYLAHRVAWIYLKGHWPKYQIDHINGNPLDNRIDNLRDAPRSTNAQNQRRAQKSNKCGLLGVSLHKGQWRATINSGGKCRHIGYYKNPNDAHQAYLDKKRELHEGCTI